MKRNKKFLISTLLTFLISILVIIYFFDPFEPFHNYSLPSGDNDFILCYYKADLGAKNKTYYIINIDGTVKRINSEYPLNYSDLAEYNGQTDSQQEIAR